jgi:hypothetical protein
MRNKALMSLYHELDRIRKSGETPEVRLDARSHLDAVADKLNRLYVSPTKTCLRCGRQLKTWTRSPWWRCVDDTCKGGGPKKRFAPDPPLTPTEIETVCRPIAEAMGFIIFPIDCSTCHAFLDENGQPLIGYLRHPGAQNVYALDAVMGLWDNPPRPTMDSRHRRLAYVADDGRIQCWRCSPRETPARPRSEPSTAE